MYRRLLIIVSLLFIVVDFSSICSAQKPTEFRPKIPTGTATVTSLRPILAKMRQENKLVQGKNLVLTTKAAGGTGSIKLWATVDKGMVTKWQATDASGKNLPTDINTFGTRAAMKCRVCTITIDSAGNPKGECYEIDCKDVPKPKPKTAAATR